MPETIRISPVTRIEGHLDIEVTVDTVSGTPQVVDAKAAGMMFRGFEMILKGRDPLDACHYTQRVCGVCPVSHGMASALALEDAAAIVPTDNGRITRNLGLGANFIQSHILHFYHLAAPDYINTAGILDMSPWKPRFEASDMIAGDTAATLVDHYVQALAMRRKAHQMGAIYCGRLPMASNFVPGGSTEVVRLGNLNLFRELLGEIRAFIDGTYLPDVEALAAHFANHGYYEIGEGCGRLLAYGVFDLDAAGSSKLLARGRYADAAVEPLDTNLIKEYVGHSWYAPASGNLNPADGITEPAPGDAGGYSWVKSPRYEDDVYELGPLARMWVNGDYTNGISVLDRLKARALETKKVADAMDGWLDALVPEDPVYTYGAMPENGAGIGLTEAPRGALGHWTQIVGGKIDRYQIITPTAWNASPRDDQGQLGALEQALIGTPVSDMTQPLEVLRVVHSVDPCLACAVHMVRPGGNPDRCVVPVGIQLTRGRSRAPEGAGGTQ
jgi:hydrogenase large subunit